DRDDPRVEDHERALAPRGERAARAIGRHLQRERIAIDLVLCSTARRAVETWRLAAAELESPPPVALDASLYLSAPAQILARVRRAADGARSILVVAHNPGLQLLALELAAAGEAAPARVGKFPTGALASFALGQRSFAELAPGSLKLTAF